VADIDNPDSSSLELSNDAEQLLDISALQTARRFVHENYSSV
jgi:hypothetical protein